MKSKNYIFLLAVTFAALLSSCNSKPAQPLTSTSGSSGASLQDSVLPKVLFKLVHSGSSYYFADYAVDKLVVDTTKSPYGLTLNAQSAYYDATNAASVLHNGTTTSQISSPISVNLDTVSAVDAGPFDMSNGYIYSTKGYLHYANKTSGDSCICPVAEVIYFHQSGAGQPLLIGFVTQIDMHSPKPYSQK